jgi:hypothetical protein
MQNFDYEVDPHILYVYTVYKSSLLTNYCANPFNVGGGIVLSEKTINYGGLSIQAVFVRDDN